jgi:hypothetical protein
MVSANSEKLPVKSTMSRDRLKFHKIFAIPLIELRVYIVGGIVIIISHYQVRIVTDSKKFPVQSTIYGDRLELHKARAIPPVEIGSYSIPEKEIG